MSVKVRKKPVEVEVVMKNYEKYKDEIIKILRYSESGCLNFVIPNVLKPMGFDCSDVSCESCHRLFFVWLLNEYKEPKLDWSKIPVDTKIYVKDTRDGKWDKRYFAKYEDGHVYAWEAGGTSWSCDNTEMTRWLYVKLAEEEKVENK